MSITRGGLTSAFAWLLLGSGFAGGSADGQCQSPGCEDPDPTSLLQAPQGTSIKQHKSKQLKNSAIVVIDMQNDFADPNGTLHGTEGHLDLLGPINALLDLDWGLRVFTADNHPDNHVSFNTNYPDYVRTINNGGFDIVELNYSSVSKSQNAQLCGAQYVERYGKAGAVCNKWLMDPRGQIIASEGTVLQETYPPHCVQGSWGQKILSGLKFNYSDPDDHLLLKGQNAHIDSYSAIFNNLACVGDGVVHRNSEGTVMSSECIPKGPIYPQETSLPDLLRVSKVEHVYFVGLCRDYCVKYSSMHSAFLGKHFGWETYLIEDATAFCNPLPSHQTEANQQMGGQGVKFVKSSDLTGVM